MDKSISGFVGPVMLPFFALFASAAIHTIFGPLEFAMLSSTGIAAPVGGMLLS